MTRQVLAAIGSEKVAVVMQDDYYRDQSHMPPEDRRKQNYDHPDAFDWPLMAQHLAALRKGEAIEMPVYDFAADNRSSGSPAALNASYQSERSEKPAVRPSLPPL